VLFGLSILFLLQFIEVNNTAGLLGLLKSFIDTGNFPTKYFDGVSRVYFLNLFGALNSLIIGYRIYKGEVKLANRYKELSESIHEGIVEAMQSIVPIQTSLNVDELIPD